MAWKVEGQPGVGQQEAQYYLDRLGISQCMGLDRIYFKGAGIQLKLLKELPDVIMRLQSFSCRL